MIDHPLFPQFIAALLGGTLPFLGTIFSQWKSKKDEKKQIRRALITEIDNCYIGTFHAWVQLLVHREHDIDIDKQKYDLYIHDEDNRIFQAVKNQENDDYLHQTIDYFKHWVLSSQVYDSNSDKIGLFDGETSAPIILYYQELKATQKLIDEIRSENTDPSEIIQVKNYYYLENQIARLADLKRDALLALDADEYINVKKTYKRPILKKPVSLDDDSAKAQV